MAKSKKINLIFLGGFEYPHGMAGTKRIQHAVDALKKNPDISIYVVILRQSIHPNPLSGTYQGIAYSTVMSNLIGAMSIVFLPIQSFRTTRLLKQLRKADAKNIIYNYGPLILENILPLYYARHLGYKIVFDIVEDDSVARGISCSFVHKIKTDLINWLDPRMRGLASGIVVVSSHLEKKYRRLGEDKIPIHFRPISIDMDFFPERAYQVKSETSLFYGGSFDKKDGLPFLLDAFDRLAAKRGNVRLVLSGRGDDEAMRAFNARRQLSPYKDRIEYLGYLDDEVYYTVLNSMDIPCMTRVNLAYAHAGFPFKLGEFLATGKPVIATRVSDVDGFLVDRQNAMLVEPGDVVGLCQAAEYLMDNPERASVIGQHGRKISISLFDSKVQGQALLEYLRHL